MKKKLFLTLALIAIASLAFGQALDFGFYRVIYPSKAFSKYIRANEVIYVQDSNQFYRVTIDYNQRKSMRNVFADGNYVQITMAPFSFISESTTGIYFGAPVFFDSVVTMDTTLFVKRVITVGDDAENSTGIIYLISQSGDTGNLTINGTDQLLIQDFSGGTILDSLIENGYDVPNLSEFQLGQIIRVDSAYTGDITSNGSIVAPYVTITEGLAVAGSRDLVLVYPGTYPEGLVITEDSITVASWAGPEVTRINTVIASGAGIALVDNTTIKGFYLTGDAGGAVIELDGGEDYVKILDNTIDITGASTFGVSVGASGSTGLLIDGNKFLSATGDGNIWASKTNIGLIISNNYFVGTDSTSSYAIQVAGSDGGRYINNVIEGMASGIFLHTVTSGSAGTFNEEISGNIVRNCGNGIRLGHTSMTVNMDSVLVFDNTCYYNSFGLMIANDAQVLSGTFIVEGNIFTLNTVDVRNAGTAPAYMSNFVGGNISTLGSATVGTGLFIGADDGGAIGSSGVAFSDLFLADGGIIDFNAGDATITHATDLIILSNANTRVDRLEIDGANDWIDVATDLFMTASADIQLDPAGLDVRIGGEGTGLYLDYGSAGAEDHDVSIFFGDDATNDAHSFIWDDGDARFELSDNTFINGSLIMSSLDVTGVAIFRDSISGRGLSLFKDDVTIDASRLIFSNTGSSVFIGEDAGLVDDLTNNFNVFIGQDAGKANTTGASNTAVGVAALTANIAGDFNTSIGMQSLTAATGGSYNTAIGKSALESLLTTQGNTAIGNNALDATTANYNTAVGQDALGATTTGGNNSAIGRYSLLQNILGANNSAIGYGAGQLVSGGGNLTDVDNSVFLGAYTRANADSETNQIVIGFEAKGKGDNSGVFGDDNVTDIWMNENGTATLHAGAGILSGVLKVTDSISGRDHFLSKLTSTMIGAATFGADGTDGQIIIYAEQATDRTATLQANAAMTGDAVYSLPADEPAGTYVMTMTPGGAMGFSAPSIVQAASGSFGLNVSRDIAEAGSNPLVTFLNDNAANTQTTLFVDADGTGGASSYGIHIDSENAAATALKIDAALTEITLTNGATFNNVASVSRLTIAEDLIELSVEELELSLDSAMLQIPENFDQGVSTTVRAKTFIYHDTTQFNNTDWHTLYLDATSNLMIIPPNSTWTGTVMVAGMETVLGQYFSYAFQFSITRDNANNTVLRNSTPGIVIESDATYACQIIADDTNESVLVQVMDSDGAGELISWVAKLDVVEVVYFGLP